MTKKPQFKESIKRIKFINDLVNDFDIKKYFKNYSSFSSSEDALAGDVIDGHVDDHFVSCEVPDHHRRSLHWIGPEKTSMDKLISHHILEINV